MGLWIGDEENNGGAIMDRGAIMDLAPPK